MSFTGFSEEDLKRIKTEGGAPEDHTIHNKKPMKFAPAKKKVYQYKTVDLQNQKIDDAIDDLQFEKCRLSLKPTPVSSDKAVTKVESTCNENGEISNSIIQYNDKENKANNNSENSQHNKNAENSTVLENIDINTEKNNANITPDVVRGVDYVEDDLASHRAKLEELQMKQKIMEEQNKKRKEMLSKALAHRTRQTEEEVLKLEKIKKELQVLDGQFSQDVGVLRKKIDLACLTYSEAEKHYLKVEKEFLQAKIQLQKEREKKELLTEHLCALITHNETRKAQKLETLMLELASHRTVELTNGIDNEPKSIAETDDRTTSPVIVDGVDQKTGKMVEFNGNS